MKRLWAGFATAIVTVTLCMAQGDRGTLTGLVTDNSGSVIPVVVVTAVNMDSNSVFKSATTGAGAYTVPNLPIGNYRLEFVAPGFKKLERSSMQLTQGQVLRLDMILEIGSVTETIEVTAVASGIETDTPRVSTNMPNSQLRDLPISMNGGSLGRSSEDWAFKLVPGIGRILMVEPHQRDVGSGAKGDFLRWRSGRRQHFGSGRGIHAFLSKP